MLKENSLVPPAGNTLCSICQNNTVNKIYHENNKYNKNQNAVVMEIEEKLFKD